MSGSPSNGGGGAPAPIGGDCTDVSFTVSLTGPDPDVVRTLAPGTELRVRRERIATFPAAVGYLGDGRRAGTIASGQLPDLLRCMEEGYRFRATVQTVRGGNVTVRVECTGMA
jgi:hypothetical protein